MARTADEMCPTALFLTVLAGSGQVSRASLTVACLTGAAGLAGPWIGTRLDSSASPRKVTATAMAVIATALLATAAITSRAAWTPLPPAVDVGAVLVLAALAGAAAPVVSGGWTAQLGGLVEPAALPGLTALDASTYNLAGIAGPGLVGLLSAAVSARAALSTAAVLMTAALVAALRVPVPVTFPGRRTVRRGSWWRGWRDARILVGSPAMRWVTVTTTIGHLGMGVAFVAAPVRGAELWQASAGGLLLASIAVGALAGTATMSRGRFRAAGERAVATGTAGVGGCLLLTAAAPSVAAAAAVLAIAGWFEGVLFTGLLRVRHREAPPGMRSTVFTTAASLKIAAFALGVAGSGRLSPSGVVLFVLAGGIQFLALGVGAATRARRSGT